MHRGRPQSARYGAVSKQIALLAPTFARVMSVRAPFGCEGHRDVLTSVEGNIY